MKRKHVCLLTIVCMSILVLTGCEKKKEYENTKIESTERWGECVVNEDPKKADMDEYVELGEYKGLHLGKTEIDEHSIEQEIKRILKNTQVVDGTAQKGDAVYISYTASAEGEILKNNFNSGEEIILGKSDKIEGFDDGVEGMRPGETKDITVKVPKGYELNPELVGKKITFHVNIDTITRPYEKLTEEWVKTYTQYDDVEEFRENVKKNLQQAAELDEELNNEQNIWTQLFRESKVKKYLKECIDSVEKQYDTNIKNQLSLEELSLEQYLKLQGITKEDYEKQRSEEIKKEAAKNMIIRAIAEKEGFSEKDSEYREIFEEIRRENNISKEDLIKLYGEKQLEQEIMKKRVLNLIKKNAK